MSLIYRHPSGGTIHQCGAMEIPLKLNLLPFALVVLSAKEYQPKGKMPRILLATPRLYVPLNDSSRLKGRELKDTVHFADQAAKAVTKEILRGKNALVTCWAGLNRSGLISGLAIKKLSGLPGPEVTFLIRKRRSQAALFNPLFAKIVETY
jgi:hypothetical protein